MTSLAAQIYRMGQAADVKTETQTGSNEFGNAEFSYTTDRTVHALRTYPNRNTSLESSVGDRTQDEPVFIVAKGPNVPTPPQPEERIVYDSQAYEVKAHTEYNTHVEFFGEPIIH
jgi:hypothetical protein